MTKELKRRVGLQVRAARLHAGMTQERVAELIDRTVESVSNIERGRTLPTLQTLELLSRHLGIPLREFFSEETELDGRSRRRIELELRLRETVRGLSDDAVEAVVRQTEVLADYTVGARR